MFGVTRISPIDPAVALVGPEAPQVVLEKVRHDLGLDRPVWVQFGVFAKRLISGDLGMSTLTRRPVAQELLRRYPYTILLATLALILSVALGVPLALISARTSNRLLDQTIQVLSLVGAATPAFLLGIILQWIFYGEFGLLPGRLDTTSAGSFLASLILPVITLSGITLGIVARMTFSMAREILDSDYIRTARAKGLHESTILAKHCLKNLAPTLLTITGLRFGAMLAGSVYVESIFGIPGIGSFAVTAILNNDYPAVIGVGMSIGLVFTFVNMLVDFLYPIVDPQISTD